MSWWRASGMLRTVFGRPTIPELLLVLEVIRNLKFHTTQQVMSTSPVFHLPSQGHCGQVVWQRTMMQKQLRQRTMAAIVMAQRTTPAEPVLQFESRLSSKSSFTPMGNLSKQSFTLNSPQLVRNG